MSVSYHIACLTCKEHLWIGQSSECFYSGEKHTMEALRVFLFKHVSHAPKEMSDKGEYHELVFVPEPFNSNWEHKSESEKWEEIEADIYKTKN